MTPPALVVLAAGMGTRFGGDKQLSEVGPRGETILDLNSQDAAAAGFGSLVVVTRPELETEVRSRLATFAAKAFSGAVSVAIQEIPAGRTKPLGTADAVVRAEPFVRGAFAVANADDVYGEASFAALFDHLAARPTEAAVVGYRLGDTLSAEGSVSRAVLRFHDDGRLASITETSVGPADPEQDRLVSMNLWAFPASAFRLIDREARAILGEGADEAFLPHVVNRLTRSGALTTRVLPTDAEWIGMTYASELEGVRDQVRARRR